MTWNGNRRSALTLTFDDGLPSQIDHALPALDKRGIPATFFVIQNSMYDSKFRADVWRDAANRGHEIGAHSVNHGKPADLGVEAQKREVMDCKEFIEQQTGANVTSYCYPYTHVNQHVRAAAMAKYKQARGGRVARADKYMIPGDNVDLYNTPCYHVGPGCFKERPDENIAVWIAEAVKRGAWLTLMLHGVGNPGDWDNITVQEFNTLLDLMEEAQNRGAWLTTFANAADSYRAGH